MSYKTLGLWPAKATCSKCCVCVNTDRPDCPYVNTLQWDTTEAVLVYNGKENV